MLAWRAPHTQMAHHKVSCALPAPCVAPNPGVSQFERSRPASYLQARAQRIEVHIHAHEASQPRREAVLLEVGVDVKWLAL